MCLTIDELLNNKLLKPNVVKTLFELISDHLRTCNKKEKDE